MANTSRVEPNYSTSIFQFCDSASTRLRLQSFDIRLDDEPRVGTQLRRYLISSIGEVQVASFVEKGLQASQAVHVVLHGKMGGANSVTLCGR